MTSLSLAQERWFPLVLVVLVATIVGTVIVTIWPPFG